MSNVVVFPDRYQRDMRKLDPETRAVVDGCMRQLDRERSRRQRMIDAGQIDERWLYMMVLFKLTAVSRPRTCDSCGSRVSPGEIHFFRDGLVCCQRPECTLEDLS